MHFLRSPAEIRVSRVFPKYFLSGFTLSRSVWIAWSATLAYLAILSLMKRCGKTRLGEVLAASSRTRFKMSPLQRPHCFGLLTGAIAAYSLMRRKVRPIRTARGGQAVLAILNSGHPKGAKAYRSMPPEHEVVGFNTCCPKVFIAIKSIPATVRNRAIVIQMRRKRKNEPTVHFLFGRAQGEADSIRRRLESLVHAVGETVAEVYRNLTDFEELSNRDAEIWQPLFAVGSVLAPEKLPDLRRAALALSGSKAERDTDNSLELQLLTDIAGLLEHLPENLTSKDLVGRLPELEDSPWGKPGRKLTPNRLARMLRPFGVSTKPVRIGEGTPKGYVRKELEEANSPPSNLLDTRWGGGV